MSRLLSFVLGLAVLSISYFYTFGIPSWIPLGTGSEVEESAAGAKGGGSGRAGGRSRGGATVVTVGEIEYASFNDTLRAIGTSEAINHVDVVSDVAGQVEEISLTSNTPVKAGDVLLKLDNRTQSINLEIAKASLKQAQEQVSRYEKLGTGNASVVSAVTVADAKTALSQAQLQVSLAENALEERTIRAPIDGILGLSRIKTGANLANGTTIVTIDDIEQLLVEFELPERALGLLALQKEVLLSTPVFAGKVFKGEVYAYDNRIDSTTRTITVQARVDNDDHSLLPGMSFSVRLINESEPGAFVPTNAISWTRNGSQIWTVEDGAAKAVPASIVMRQQDNVWIDTKLPAGTQIVTDGTQKLRDGIKITASNASPTGERSKERKPKAEGEPIARRQPSSGEAGAAQ